MNQKPAPHLALWKPERPRQATIPPRGQLTCHTQFSLDQCDSGQAEGFRVSALYSGIYSLTNEGVTTEATE